MRKRMLICVVTAVLFSLSLIVRTGYIATSGAYTVSEGYNSYSVLVDNLAPNLYYSNFTKMTNNKLTYLAVLKPSEKTLAILPKLFENTDEIIDELKKGKPIVRTVDVSYAENVRILAAYENENTCSQLIERNSAGLLQYLPNSVGSRKISFYVDAKGRALSGDDGRLTDDNYDSKQGLQLTIDKQVQQITYDACREMASGCAVVMNVKDGAILAVVNQPNHQYLNKVFSLYSVGSVFKIAVAAAALENNVDPEYQCSGSITVGNVTFSCQKQKTHGVQHIKEAMANSCNCYFVNLALQLGAKKLLQTADTLGFNGVTKLYDGWEIQNASLPSESDLRSKGQLALLGFGQGTLLATPLQICSMLCTVANGGSYHSPYLVDKTVDDSGNRTSYPRDISGTKVLTKSQELLTDLRYVVSDGTGRSADYRNQSAGKTATAQTGQFAGGEEKLNTWFAGVYPYDNPQYAIVIMTEDGTSGATDCCPIFRTIVEKLSAL